MSLFSSIRRRGGSRGNILAMAMAFMFILVTITIAMHTTQSRAVRTVTQAEAEIRYRQAAEFKTVNLLFNNAPYPSGLKMEADETLVGDFQMANSYGKDIWGSMPDWEPKSGAKYAPGHKTYKLEPDTNDAALDVFADKYTWMVCHNEGGYAVYAPKGTVKMGNGIGWRNPNFTDTSTVLEAYSGVPFEVASQGSIEVEKMPYGNAYSVQGPIDLGSDANDLAVPYVGPLPMRSYEAALKQSLTAARSSLENAANSGNKTNDLSGGVLAGVGGIMDMLVSGDASKLNVSLEQAMEFPFPMIPGFSATLPPFFYEFWFHMPYAPDFYQKEKADDGSGKSTGQKVADLDKKIKNLEKELQTLKDKKAAEPDEDKKKDIQKDIDKKQKELDDAKAEMDSLKKQIEKEAADAKSNIENNSTAPENPTTRQQDKDIPVPKTGLKGWAYGPLMSNMLNLLVGMITGDLEKIGESVMAKVRVVHFGGKTNEPEFKFDDGFFCDATFTVPRGRTFKYNGKMEVEGDLWLQKGSVMQVTGNLKVSNPEPGSNPLKPCGKVVLEQGATLIVGGDFECEGDPRFGSVWACSPPTHLTPVSAAIFVQGKATLPYGSFSAATLEEMAGAVGGIDAVADALQVLFQDVAPNLAKIAGPFHTRQPYFASYATTFQLTFVPTPFGPIPVPTPIPLPKKNVLIPLFRALTMVYTGTLNMALGENLYTHCDWWVFGEGVVPVMIKINPLGPLNSIKDISLSGLSFNIDWKDYMTELTTTVIKGAAEFAVVEVGKALLKEVMKMVPGGSIIGMVTDQIVDAVDLKSNAFDDFQEKVVDAAIGPFVEQFKNIKDKIEDEIRDNLKEAYLREVVGPLIYAQSIEVGDPDDPPLLMAGMLVAEDSLDCNVESFVGSLTSFNGNITAKDVYFTPLFTRASLYVPKSTAGTAIGRAVQVEFGKNFDNGQAVDVGTGVWQVTTEGWSR